VLLVWRRGLGARSGAASKRKLLVWRKAMAGRIVCSIVWAKSWGDGCNVVVLLVWREAMAGRIVCSMVWAKSWGDGCNVVVVMIKDVFCGTPWK
jgi:hypothetical protein